MSSNLKTLISKLGDTSRRAAERAASLCMSRGHYEVDVEHVLLALLEEPASDFSLLCRHFDVSTTALQRDLDSELGRFKTGNTRTPVFSAQLPVLLQHAWLIASLESHLSRIRSGHMLLALLTEPSLAQLALRTSPLFGRFKVEELKHRLPELTPGSQKRATPCATPMRQRPPPTATLLLPMRRRPLRSRCPAAARRRPWTSSPPT